VNFFIQDAAQYFVCLFHQPFGVRLINGGYFMFDGQLFHQFLNELNNELQSII
jgi:hypothetical protein